VGKGDSVLFWADMWNGRNLQHSFPHLYSFAVNTKITIKAAAEAKIFQDLFQTPLSVEAFEEYCKLEIIMQTLQLSEENDRWEYIWGNGSFSSAKAYKHLIGSCQTHPAYKWIWKSKCQMKHKVFFWLLLRDILNTRGLLRRKHMYLDSYVCELWILQREESLGHLFFKCGFAKNCWTQIGVNVPSWLPPIRAIRRIKRSLRVPFAIEIIMVMCWSIWTERNSWLLSNKDPIVQNCKSKFKQDFLLVIHKAKEQHKDDMRSSSKFKQDFLKGAVFSFCFLFVNNFIFIYK
jgi:hypothetical protein